MMMTTITMHQTYDYVHCIRSACQQERLPAPEIEAVCAALDDPSPLQPDFEAFAVPILRDFPELRSSTVLLACYFARVDILAEDVLPGGTPLPDLDHYASLDENLSLVIDALIADGGRDAPALRRWFSVVMKLTGRINGVKTHQKTLNAIAALLSGTPTAKKIQMGSGMTLATAARSLLVHHALGTQPCKKPSRSPQVGAKRKRDVYHAYTDVARCLPSVRRMEQVLLGQATTTGSHGVGVAPLLPSSPNVDTLSVESKSTTASLSGLSNDDELMWTEEHVTCNGKFQGVVILNRQPKSVDCPNYGSFTVPVAELEYQRQFEKQRELGCKRKLEFQMELGCKKQLKEQPPFNDVELDGFETLHIDDDIDLADLATFLNFDESPSSADGTNDETNPRT